MNDIIQGYRISSRDDLPAQPHETDYLKPKHGSSQPLEDLHKAAAREGSNCQGREAEFSGYETPPTAAQARAMCYRCPVYDLCKTYAEAGHPAWGIWGGEVHGRSLVMDEREEHA